MAELEMAGVKRFSGSKLNLRLRPRHRFVWKRTSRRFFFFFFFSFFFFWHLISGSLGRAGAFFSGVCLVVALREGELAESLFILE
jgi:hypothetical protein